jgi:uncharacterized protein (TIGR03437 family)
MGKWSMEACRRSVFILAAAAGALFSPGLYATPASSLTLTVSSNPTAYGQPVTLSATVTPSSANGAVTFFDGATPLGISTLSSGVATFAARGLAAGGHSFWAYYAGNSSFAPAKSAAVSETIRARAQAGFNWTAAIAADMNPVALATGDFNGDGRLDIAVANFAGGDVSVLLGNGDGTFQAAVNYTVGQNPAAIAAADFNGDGKTDLAVVNSGDDTLSILFGNGSGAFGAAVAYSAGSVPCSLAPGDFNGDGVIDLAVANCAGSNISIFSGNAGGTFQPAANYPAGTVPSFIAVSDFNSDGNADLVVADAGDGAVSVMPGNGSGAFWAAVTYPTGNYPLGLVIADFNGDGKPDIAAAGADSVAILLNSGAGSFAAAVSYTAGEQPYTAVAGDFNGDGDIDLLFAASASNAVTFLSGRGDGTFQTGTAGPWLAGNTPSFLAAADFNSDGLADLAVADDGGGISILTGVAPAVLSMNCLTPGGSLVLNSNSWSAPCSLSSGTAPFTWSVSSGTLPDGIFLSSTTGTTVTVKGTPITPGAYAFTVTATDSSVPTQTALHSFSGTIAGLGAIIGSLSPSARPTGSSAFVLTVNGSGFQNGATVNWNGTPEPTTFVSTTQLTASIPASAIVAAGSAAISVTNPSTAASASVPFTIDALPVIASLSPASAIAGGAAFTLTVNGSNFTPGATVKWNSTALATSFVSSIQLTASVPSTLVAAAASVSITVVNTDGGISSAAAFTVNAASTGGSGGGGTPSGGGGTPSGGGGTPSGGGGTPSGGGGSSSGSTSISVSADSIAFNWQAGGSTPSPQTLSIFTGISSADYSTKVQTDSGSAWLHVSSSSGKTPAAIVVSVDTSALSQTAAGTYTGFISVAGAKNNVNVPVTLTALAAPAPAISVATAAAGFSASQGGPPQSGQITVGNTGGGSVSYSVSVASGSPWLKLTAGVSGSATASNPGVAIFTVDPSASGVGVFAGSVQVKDNGSGRTFAIPVTLTVNAGSNTIALSQTALSFVATAQQPQPAKQIFAVTISAAAALTFTTQSSAAWLQATPATGQTTAANPSSVSVLVNATGLTIGVYYASIDIASSGAVNSPQTVTVILNVVPSAPAAVAAPLSVTLLGATPQQISVSDPSGTPASFAATAVTTDGGNWLTVTPATGVPNNGAAPLTISATPANASPGIHHGTISVGFDDGTMQSVQVMFIPSGGSCTPSGLAILPDGMSGGTVVAGIPQTIQVLITDDCGNPATGANSVAQTTFTSGDAAVNLVYAGTGSAGGIWQGTWIPTNTSAQVQMLISARQGTLTPASLTLPFAVTAADPSGPGSAGAILNAASATGPQVVAPGSYVAIYGAQLAGSGYGLATSTPFTSTLDNTQVFLGGQPMPLYYASPTQINALVPQGLAPNTVLQLVVQRGSTRSAPIPIVITPYQPGIYSQNQAGTGQGSIEISGTALLAATASPNSRPAARGTDYVAIYCTGLGPVAGENGEQPPPDGVAASYPPLYKTIAPVTVTIGGVDAPVVFAGLTPTLVGLYQVDAQVPAGAPVGDSIPVIVSVTDPATGAVSQSNMVTIAVQ